MAARKRKAPEHKNGSAVVKAASEFADQTFARERGKRVRASSTVGQAGFAVYGGFIQSNEKNRELNGAARWKTYEELVRNVSIVATGIRHVLNLVGKASWTVVPAEDGGARAEEIAETVDSILYDMATPWYRIVKRITTYAFYGFSLQEWTTKKREDGVIGFLDVESRAQHSIERWDVDVSGTVHGVEQRSVQTQEALYIPRAKLVYGVDDTLTDSPEGVGLLRHVAPAAKRLQRYEQLEGVGFESDLRGIPVGRAPYSALAAEVKAGRMTQSVADERAAVLEGFVENHVRTEATGLVLDSMTYQSLDEAGTPSSVYQWGIELLKSESTAHEWASVAIARLTRDCARLIGVEGLLLGESGAGSLAMARAKNDVLGLLIDGMLVEAGLIIEKDLLEPLFSLNGWPIELMPTMRPEKLQLRALDEITATLKDMASAGAVLGPDDPAINSVRELAGLPEIDLEKAAEDAAVMREAEVAALQARGLSPGGEPGDEVDDPNPKKPVKDSKAEEE